MRGTNGVLVFEQAFEDADGGVVGGAVAFGRFAVPSAVGELFVEEAACEGLVGTSEVCAEGEDSTVDAGFFFPLEEGIAAELTAAVAVGGCRAEVWGAEVPAARIVVPAEISFGAGER
jgi:hypothetical protein